MVYHLVYRGPHEEREFLLPSGITVRFKKDVPTTLNVEGEDEAIVEYLLRDHEDKMKFDLVEGEFPAVEGTEE